jgi:hypothetical protein
MVITAHSRVLEKLRVALLDKKSPTSHKPVKLIILFKRAKQYSLSSANLSQLTS